MERIKVKVGGEQVTLWDIDTVVLARRQGYSSIWVMEISSDCSNTGQDM